MMRKALWADETSREISLVCGLIADVYDMKAAAEFVLG